MEFARYSGGMCIVWTGLQFTKYFGVGGGALHFSSTYSNCSDVVAQDVEAGVLRIASFRRSPSIEDVKEQLRHLTMTT